MNAEQMAVAQQNARNGEQHLQVVVVTTSGTFPKDGSDRVPAHQPVKVELHKVQKELEIADTVGWIVTVGNTEIDPDKSYADNGYARPKSHVGPKQ
jgi:hypothetical protein